MLSKQRLVVPLWQLQGQLPGILPWLDRLVPGVWLSPPAPKTPGGAGDLAAESRAREGYAPRQGFVPWHCRALLQGWGIDCGGIAEEVRAWQPLDTYVRSDLEGIVAAVLSASNLREWFRSPAGEPRLSYQTHALGYALMGVRAMALHWGPGSGKTRAAIEWSIITSALSVGRGEQPAPIIVTTPSNVVRHWERQVRKWTTVDPVCWIAPSTRRKRDVAGLERLREWRATSLDPMIVIVSHDNIVDAWAADLHDLPRGVATFDEAHLFRQVKRMTAAPTEDGGVEFSERTTAGGERTQGNVLRDVAAWATAGRLELSVGPDSIVTLRGGLFGPGWVGRIEDADALVRSCVPTTLEGEYEIARPANVESRGWTGNGFGWKALRAFIRHRAPERLTRVVAGRALEMTEDHSVYRSVGPDISAVRASELSAGDEIPCDDGRNWLVGASSEPKVSTASLVADVERARAAVDFAEVLSHKAARRAFGISARDYANWTRQAHPVHGPNLPLPVYWRLRSLLPKPRGIYLASRSTKRMYPPTIRMSDYAYLLGFYLGDGWLNVETNRVTFAVELSGVDSFAAALKARGLTYSIKKMPRGSVEIRVNDTIFARLIRHTCGKLDAHEKVLPAEWLTTWSRDARAALLAGLTDSDGHVNRRGRLNYTTTSYLLASGVCVLATSLGFHVSLYSQPPQRGGCIAGRVIEGRRVRYNVSCALRDVREDGARSDSALGERCVFKGRNGFRVEVKRQGVKRTGSFKTRTAARKASRTWRNDLAAQSFTARVKRTEPGTWPEYVYDLEMTDHPSFAASGLLVHNTATPIGNKFAQLWVQLDLLMPGEFGSFYTWSARHAQGRPGEYGGWDTFGAANIEEHRARVRYFFFEVPVSESNKLLPAKRRETIYLPLTEQVAELGGWTKILAQSKQEGRSRELEAKLMQAASRKRKYVTTRALECIQAGQKVVILTGRRKDVQAIFGSLTGTLLPKRPAPTDDATWAEAHGEGNAARNGLWWASGEVDLDTRAERCDEYMRWKSSEHEGRGACLVGTLDCLGIGIDLQDTDLGLIAMLPWTWDVLWQAEGRFQRQGMTRPVLIEFVIAEGTYDEHVAQTFLSKLPAIGAATPDEEVAKVGESLRGLSDMPKLLSAIFAKIAGGQSTDEVEGIAED